VFDVVRGQVYRRTPTTALEIPAGAVVVPGSRPVRERAGVEWGLSLYAPIIVKYRDARTDAATSLEEALR
jgi:2,3,4,5-tetrahydropyridine-2-carboxylate N-succinyltransferase